MPWLPYVAIDREIRAVLAKRMEHGATDELDRKLAHLIEGAATGRADLVS